MGKKRDIKQVESIAKEFRLTREQRAEFGDFIEQEKAGGWRGSLNDKGDFTYKELHQRAQEFKKLIN